MKHILNNLSNEEKNSIREQHTGGKQLNIENFSKLVNNKLGTVKTIVKEKINEYGSPYSQEELEMMRDPEYQKHSKLSKLCFFRVSLKESTFLVNLISWGLIFWLFVFF